MYLCVHFVLTSFDLSRAISVSPHPLRHTVMPPSPTPWLPFLGKRCDYGKDDVSGRRQLNSIYFNKCPIIRRFRLSCKKRKIATFFFGGDSLPPKMNRIESWHSWLFDYLLSLEGGRKTVPRCLPEMGKKNWNLLRAEKCRQQFMDLFNS